MFHPHARKYIFGKAIEGKGSQTEAALPHPQAEMLYESVDMYEASMTHCLSLIPKLRTLE